MTIQITATGATILGLSFAIGMTGFGFMLGHFSLEEKKVELKVERVKAVGRVWGE